MSKYSDYHNTREAEVLESPDYYIIRVFTNGQWVESVPFAAAECLKRFTEIRKMPQNYRAVLYAVRVFDDGPRLANISAARLSALVELKAG